MAMNITPCEDLNTSKSKYFYIIGNAQESIEYFT
jgi:hypothetical protein